MKVTVRNSGYQRRLGIYSRAILLVGIVLTASTAIVTYLNIRDKNRNLTEALESRIVALARHQAASVANALWDLNRDGANAVLRGLAQDPDFLYADVKDENGKVFIAFELRQVPEELSLNVTEDVVLRENGQQKVIGSLSVALSRERLIQSQNHAITDAVVLGTILFVVMMVAVSIVLRMVMNPLSSITSRMLGVAAGSLEKPVPYLDRADQIGEVARAVDMFRIISEERKRAQETLKKAHDEMEDLVTQRTQELRQTEALFRSIIAASPAEIFVRDIDGRMLLVNRAWEQAQGISEKDAVGKTNWDLLPKDRADRYMEQDRIVLSTEESLDSQIEQSFGEEKRYFHTIKFPLFDTDGNISGIGGITSDITEYRRAEERLRQAQKMEAVGQLTGGIAHDFNNLLAVIQGNAELMTGEPKTDEPMLQAIKLAARRGAELTHRLLAFSRQQYLDPQSIDLAALVRDLSGLLRRTLGETIEIKTIAEKELWSAIADQGQVENALLNLALNARDAMPTGGKLTIECANVQLDADYLVDNPEANAGDYVMLAVSDSGSGMSAEVLSHAFEPFFTTKEVGQGSGLGLSMVYGFAKQSGGHVSIYSEEGQGTTVKLYLPRAETLAELPEEPRVETALKGRGEVILVIEDESEVRALAVNMLKNLGYRTLDVADAASAWALFERGEKIDLVLSDVVLPGGTSGPDFAKTTRAAYPDLKVIFMSGYPAEAAKSNGSLSSNNVLLNKPFEIQKLAKALRDALD